MTDVLVLLNSQEEQNGMHCVFVCVHVQSQKEGVFIYAF